MIREILSWPDKRLEMISLPVKNFDKNIATLGLDMIETMTAAGGIGLAAPQIGILLRVIVIDTTPMLETSNPLVLINPKFRSHSEKTVLGKEGCLSVPTGVVDVRRWSSVCIEASNILGETVQIEGDGLLAACVQHEIDHLNGVLMLGRLSGRQRNLLEKEMRSVIV